MALSTCKECNTKVSTLAKTCPKCGAPDPAAKKTTSQKTTKKFKLKSMGPKQILAYIAFLIAVVWTLKFIFELTSSGVKQVKPTAAKPDLLHLSCVASDNSMTTKVVIDSNNNIASVQSYPATLRASTDEYVMEYDMGKIFVTFIINRNSGLYQELWVGGSNAQTFDGKCKVSKQKF